MRKRDPRTKEELFDRMLSFDFDGDIRNLGAQPATIVRTSANKLLLTFPDSGVTFELEVHRPREFSQAAARAAPQRDRETRTFRDDRDDGLRRLEAEEPAPVEEQRPKRRYTRRQPNQRSA